jgi:predicted transcriptional regulator
MAKGGVSLYVYLPNSLYKKILERIGDKSASAFIQLALKEYLEEKERNLVREVVRLGKDEIYKQLQQLQPTDYAVYKEFINIVEHIYAQYMLYDMNKKGEL